MKPLSYLFAIFLIVTSTAQAQIADVKKEKALDKKNFIAAGLQTPFRFIHHESEHLNVSHLDQESDGDISWDGSIGHYVTFGRYLGERNSVVNCALKTRIDFDFRSDHNVIFDSENELRHDLSIASLLAMAECERELGTSWSSFFDLGLGGAVHVNNEKTIRKGANTALTALPDAFNRYGSDTQTGTLSNVTMNAEPAFAFSLGVARKLNPYSSLRFSAGYRAMGETPVFKEKVQEFSLSLGLRADF